MLQVASKSPRLAHIQDERSENPPLDGRSVIQFADIQVPDSTVAETNSELRIWHCTPGDSPSAAFAWQVDYTGTFHPSWKKGYLALTGIYIYSEYESAFLPYSTSAKTTICGFT